MKELIEKVQNGVLNPLHVYIDLKRQELELKEALDAIKPFAVAESLKWAEKSFELNGAKIEKRSSPARWDFSHIQTIEALKKRLKDLEAKAKIGTFVDEETGEMIDKAYKIEGSETIAIEFL